MPPVDQVEFQVIARPVVVYMTEVVSKRAIGALTVTRTATVALSPTESVIVTVSL